MSTAATPGTRSRGVGRPARIDRDAIAEAVLEIGLDRSSMKAVAEHLGVSVPALYHHVKNRKELLLLAAERSLADVRLPEDRGQHWSEWLREWGRYSRRALMDEPELFAQFLNGALGWDQMVDVVDSVVQVLTRQGFSPVDAVAAWDAVGSYATGSAAEAIRERALAESGHARSVELHRLSARRGRDALPGLQALLRADPPDLDEEFEDALTSLLAGIAVRRGEPWEQIAGAPLTA